MTWTRSTAAMTLLVALALAPAAGAGEATPGEPALRSLLLFGPGAGNADGVVAAGYARERVAARERPRERVGVTGIPFPADQPYWLTGGGSAAWCAPASRAPADLALTVSRARGALDVLESDKVVGIVDEFEATAPCLTEVVDPALVAELYLLRGLAWTVDSEHDLATADFARAAGIHPDLAWDVGYPPEPQQTYLVAREAAGRAEPATFGWRFSLLGEVAVTVDGRPVEPFAPLELAPVPHVVQIASGGTITSMMMRLDEGHEAVLVDRFGATSAVMSGPTDALSRVASQTILDAVAAQWNAAQVVVVDTTFREDLGEPLVYRYGVAERGFEVLSAMKEVRLHSPPHADRVRIGVGGGLRYEGVAGTVGKHFAIAPGGELELRIGRGFAPSGALDLISHRVVADGGSSWKITPQIRLGLGSRWHPRFVQPYLGLHLMLRFDRAIGRGVVTGTAVAANIDIFSPRLPGLYLRLGGSAGFIGETIFIQGSGQLGLSL